MELQEFLKHISSRKSFRAFKEGWIPESVLENILEASSRAASSKNTQPWECVLASGDTLEKIRSGYLQRFDQGEQPRPEYQYSPEPLPDVWKTRAKDVGVSLFKHKGIGREDKDKLKDHYRENYNFFGASQVLFLSTLRSGLQGTFLDCGLFLSNVLNALQVAGYGACPMYSGVSYPEVLHDVLDVAEDKIFICAVAMGVPKEHHVNEFKTTREPLEKWFKKLN